MHKPDLIHFANIGYSAEEVEFLKAVDHYQQEHGVQQPDWTEILKLVKSLGYRKVAAPAKAATTQPWPDQRV